MISSTARHALLKTFALVVAIIGLIAVEYLWDEGYFGSYWERQDSLYDPKLQVFRCLDENGEISADLEPPCLVLSWRGLKARDRRARECERNGGKHDACVDESYDWLYAKRPK